MIFFSVRFFWGLVPEVLTTLFITFDTCLAKFIIEIGVWSSCEGDRGNCMQFMENDDSEWNEVEFSGICS